MKGNPLTGKSVSKRLISMRYYPLSILMLAGIKEILIISTPRDIGNLKKFSK